MKLVLPAPSFDDIRLRADEFGRTRPAGDRLVSVVFADPSSPVWRDLRTNRGFLDERSGDAWDLFFAGLSAFAPMESDPTALRIDADRDVPRYFNPRSFSEIEHRVAAGHAAAVREHAMDVVPWQYGGGTEVVSFMAYAGEPDWVSLKSAALYAAGGGDTNLGHLTAGLARWQDDLVDPLFAPGEVPGGLSGSTSVLVAALRWTASAVTGGVAGSAAYELLSKLL